MLLNRSRIALLTVLTALLAGAPIATALAGPPPWAPAHGYRSKHGHSHKIERREYIYYPAHRVYFDPRVERYHWVDEHDVWHHSHSRPVIIEREPGVSVFFDF